ncbi:hypothetical protein AB0F05_22735 [Streptomyces microflavus]|uniref:hypothetical protein n=1 Tax=Streptomyces microflavus TaxID=1919 RepID=UPI00340A8F3C
MRRETPGITRTAGVGRASREADQRFAAPGHLAELTPDQYETPWLEGRPWGPTEGISEALSDGARCSRFVDALGRGGGSASHPWKSTLCAAWPKGT